MKILAILFPIALLGQTAQFPTAIATDQQLGVVANGVQGKLNNSLTTSSTSLNITNGTCTLAGIATTCNLAFKTGMFITLDNEIMQVCSIVTTSVTTLNFGIQGSACPSLSGRGLDGTQVAAHNLPNTGSKLVSNNITAWTHMSDKAEIQAIETGLFQTFLSPKSFGAIGDGITTDTTAVQNALNSLSSGGTLFFPQGTYKLGNITVPNGVIIQCASPQSTILKYSGSSSTPFIKAATAALSQTFSINNCTIDNGGSNSTTSVAVSLNGIWYQTFINVIFTGSVSSWGTAWSLDGSTYGTYDNTIINSQVSGTVQPLLCTGNGTQQCNSNTLINFRASGFGAIGINCVATYCGYLKVYSGDLETPSVNTSVFIDLEGFASFITGTAFDASVTSGKTYTGIKVRGSSNSTLANINSLAASGGTAKFIDKVDTIANGCQYFNETTTGSTVLWEQGDCVGGAAFTLKSVLSGPSIRLKNMDSTGSSGPCYQWGFLGYSTGYLYLQNLDCTNPVPNTNFNAVGWDTSGGMHLVQNMYMPSGGTIYDSVYKNQSLSSANNDIVGQLTVAGGGTISYSFTGSYATAPICVVSDTSGSPAVAQVTVTTSSLTITSTASHVFNYFCHGRT